MKPGTYRAIGQKSSIPPESASGAQMVGLQFEVQLQEGGTEPIAAQVCIIQKDGTPSQFTIDMLVKCFQWTPGDWTALQGEGCVAGKEVDLVIDYETFTDRNGEERTALKVRYINAPGETRGMPAAAPPEHLKALAAKYGAQFRALGGGVPAKPPTKATIPPKLGVKPPVIKGPPKPTAKAPEKATSTVDTAWAACQKTYGDEAEAKWLECLSSMGIDVDKATPEEWAKVEAAMEDNVPF